MALQRVAKQMLDKTPVFSRIYTGHITLETETHNPNAI